MLVRRSTIGQRFTVARLVAAIERRGLTIFARFDHSGLARQVGLELPPVEVVVFGNPSTGTPLMISDPRVGIELPLRMVVWEDGVPEALVGYHDPHELAGKYNLTEHQATLDRMAELLAGISAEAAGDVPV